MKIAAIDIGTNSIHMLIARASGPGAFEVIDREREVVQVGRGSFSRRRLRADAIRRTVEALARYVRLARRHQVDHILCTATAAVREASNGGEFVAAARAASGVVPRVIPAEEEGRLIHLGVRSALQLGVAPSLILDIGGGSVQMAVGHRDGLLAVGSAPLGALRLTEDWIEHDPPTANELLELRRHVRRTLRDPIRSLKPLRPVRAYGSSGSIHALAHVAHLFETGKPVRRINGFVLARGALTRLTRRLVGMTVDEIQALPGIDAHRAEVIVPGALVLAEVLDRFGLDAITISDYGVREGLVADWIERHADEIAVTRVVEDVRLRSVLDLAAKFQADMTHAQHVARLAVALFDGLRPEHGLDGGARAALRFAALLHDVGTAIGYDDHDEHSAYIVRHGGLRGLAAPAIAVIAATVEFHSRGRPRKTDQSLAEMPKRDRDTVRWLTALLCVAEGLDRSHYQLVRGVRVERRRGAIRLVAGTRGDPQLELWAARRRTENLARLAGTEVRIGLEKPSRTPGRAARAARRASPKRAMR